jgi:hypothetical protein
MPAEVPEMPGLHVVESAEPCFVIFVIPVGYGFEWPVDTVFIKPVCHVDTLEFDMKNGNCGIEVLIQEKRPCNFNIRKPG